MSRRTKGWLIIIVVFAVLWLSIPNLMWRFLIGGLWAIGATIIMLENPTLVNSQTDKPSLPKEIKPTPPQAHKNDLPQRTARSRGGASTIVDSLYHDYGGSLPFKALRDSNFNFEQWRRMYPAHAADFIAFDLWPNMTEETKNCVYAAAERDDERKRDQERKKRESENRR